MLKTFFWDILEPYISYIFISEDNIEIEQLWHMIWVSSSHSISYCKIT